MVWNIIYSILINEIIMILVYLSDPSEKSIYFKELNLSLGLKNWKIIDDEKSVMGVENSLIIIGYCVTFLKKRLSINHIWYLLSK